MRWWIASLLIVAACGKAKDKDKPATAAVNAATPAGGTPAGVPPASATTPSGTPPSAPTPPEPPAADLGQCNLLASGALSAAEALPRNNASVLTDYWLGDAEREQIKSQTGATGAMVDALKLLTLNCQGATASISIVPGAGATVQSIPFGPKTYRLDKGKGDLAVLATIQGEMMINPSGTITISTFDAHRIVATIDLAGTTMDKRALTLAGKLDYLCTGLSGCK